jgi:hypothetical protein
MVNFKNHVKAFGFTLKQSPEKIIDASGKVSYDWEGYYGGFNPKEDFEQQL